MKTIEEIRYPIVIELFKKSIFYNCLSLKSIKFMDTEIFANKIIDFDEYKGIEEIKGFDNPYSKYYKFNKKNNK